MNRNGPRTPHMPDMYSIWISLTHSNINTIAYTYYEYHSISDEDRFFLPTEESSYHCQLCARTPAYPSTAILLLLCVQTRDNAHLAS